MQFFLFVNFGHPALRSRQARMIVPDFSCDVRIYGTDCIVVTEWIAMVLVPIALTCSIDPDASIGNDETEENTHQSTDQVVLFAVVDVHVPRRWRTCFDGIVGKIILIEVANIESDAFHFRSLGAW